MANLRKTLSLVLAIVMLVSMACVSGFSASAVAFKTTEVDTATGTYTCRVLVNTSAAYIGGVGCEITYPSSLTIKSATVNSAFASSSVNTDVAGKITWNAVGLVASSANFAAITVEFTGEDGLASGFSASKFEVITSANADGSSPAYATNGDDLTLEIGRYVKADDPDPVAITLTADAAKTHRFETTTIDGKEYRVLIGVMPKTKSAGVIALFANTDITTVYKNTGVALTATANVGTGAYVENASGDRVYIAVRGDTTAAGTAGIAGKTQTTNFIKKGAKDTSVFGQDKTILGYCKFLAAATSFMPTKAATAVSVPNVADKTSITKYIASKSTAFTAQNIAFT